MSPLRGFGFYGRSFSIFILSSIKISSLRDSILSIIKGCIYLIAQKLLNQGIYFEMEQKPEGLELF